MTQTVLQRCARVLAAGGVARLFCGHGNKHHNTGATPDEYHLNRIDIQLHVATSLIAKHHHYPQGTTELGLSFGSIFPDAPEMRVQPPRRYDIHVASNLTANYHLYPQGMQI